MCNYELSSRMASKIHTLDIIKTMKKQEKAYLVKTNYIPMTVDDESVEDYASWRYAMVEWFMQIVDSFSFQQETVENTLSILDRYVASNLALVEDSDAYQRAALTSLYIAVKIHEECCLTPDQIFELSRGEYSNDILAAEEESILNAINWRVNPPTASSFARELIDIIPEELIDREQVFVSFQKQIKHTYYEEYFTTEKASMLAIAGVYNALTTCGCATKLPRFVELRLLSALGLAKEDKLDILRIRKLLINISENSEDESEQSDEEVPEKEPVSLTASPSKVKRGLVRSDSPRDIMAVASHGDVTLI